MKCYLRIVFDLIDITANNASIMNKIRKRAENYWIRKHRSIVTRKLIEDYDNLKRVLFSVETKSKNSIMHEVLMLDQLAPRRKLMLDSDTKCAEEAYPKQHK